jgi:hypothetical protein
MIESRAHPHSIEACENGIKVTAWEITKKRTAPEFFAEHTVKEVLTWSDLDLEAGDRLTEPFEMPGLWNEAVDYAIKPILTDAGFVPRGHHPRTQGVATPVGWKPAHPAGRIRRGRLTVSATSALFS